MRAAQETQHAAELRQAFLRHLPKRIDVLRRRGRRLCAEGWDINALSMLYHDAQSLAGASGKYGVLDVSEPLYALELMLQPFVREERVPDPEATARVQSLIERLDKLAPQSAAEVRLTPVVGESVDPDSGVSTQRIAPPQYWRRHVGDAPPAVPVKAAAPAAAAADPGDDTSGMSTRPARERKAKRGKPEPGPGSGKRVFVLSDGSASCTALTEMLGREGHAVEVIADAAEFTEVLSALTPDLVILGAGFEDSLDRIGERVRSARQKGGHRLSLMALAENDELPARLRAMRAGADAFVSLHTEPEQLLEQARELLEGERAEPFRVLIVEDDRSQALFAESILRNAGMETQAETDPLRVLAVLDEFRPDLILMDLYMPNVDGMELTAIIRERDAFVSTPIVFLSGEQDQDKHFAALDAGGDDFLAKPIRPKHLIAAVTNRVRRARATHRRVRRSNLRDPVTGLYERAHVLDRLSAALAREQPSLGGVLFVEIDNAPALRERLTLAVYEALATQTGALVAEQLDGDELGARFSDRSYVLLCQKRDEPALETLAEAIQTRFAEHVFDLGQQSLTVPLSIGICSLALGLGDAGAVLTAAERACRAARDDRRKIHLHRPASAIQIKDERVLAAAIGTALREDGFELLFQPILPLQGEAEQQYQVLLRLRDAAGKLRPAAELIPVAERHGSILEIDRWVLARVLRTLDERRREGAPVTLFVSQSVTSLLHAEQFGWLAQNLEARQLDGRHLVIEFKPGQVQDHIRGIRDFCAGLAPRGVRFCLSSFDAGQAAMQLLERLPVQWVKVHPKYVGNQPEALALRAELAGIVEKCHALGRQVIAPHVEDANGAAAIWMAGVDYIQGNFVQGAGHRLEFDFQAAL
jgi:PleD family two-component response regulator/EAL domain-containing protein (putative c-di-GMP-specific phosphodiesterase class I)